MIDELLLYAIGTLHLRFILLSFKFNGIIYSIINGTYELYKTIIVNIVKLNVLILLVLNNRLNMHVFYEV